MFSDLTRSDIDERYLRIKPLETIRCKEDFPPFPVSPEINSSHPDQTRLEYTLSEGAPFTVHLDRNATRLILSPRKNRSGRGRIEIRAVLGNITVRTAFDVFVTEKNDAPRGYADTFETVEEKSMEGKLRGSDPDGDPLLFTLLKKPAHGEMTLKPDGRFTYTPKKDFSGDDILTYRVADAVSKSRPSTVTLRVRPVNDPPAASGATYAIDEEQPLHGSLKMRDIDSQGLTARIVLPPGHGRLELQGSDTFLYTPQKDFYGKDRFLYVADDGNTRSRPAEVSITVLNVNDRPETSDVTRSCREDTPCRGKLSATDRDHDPLSFSLITPPANGSVTIGAKGDFRYRPKRNFFGEDRFSFTASDGRLTAPPATVRLTVASAKDDVVILGGRLGSADAALYDYDRLDNREPVPFYKTRSTTGKSPEKSGRLSLPLDRLKAESLYILTVQNGENVDLDGNGKLDTRPTKNRGTLHLLASGRSLIGEQVSANIIGELVYERLATRLKAGYDTPYLLATLDDLAREYIANDIDGDGTITYQDVLAFDYRKHTSRLIQPAAYFRDAVKNLHANIAKADGLTGRCQGEASEDLIYDVALRGAHAFIANGNRGLTIAAKEDLHAKPLARMDTPGYTRAVEAGDDLVYLADGSSGVHIVDVGDIYEPKIIATLDTFWYALDLELQYPYLYVSDGSAGMVVIGVRNSTKPEKSAVLDTPGYAFGLVVKGDYAYIADGPTGLLIVDIKNPGNPEILTAYDTPGYAFDVTVQEPYAYIADGSAGIVILDISDVRQPKVLSTIPADGTTFAVETDGKFLYTAEYEGGVRIWDVSNPKAPYKTASYTQLCGVFNIKIIGEYIYACDDFSGLVRLKKVRNIIP